MLPSMRLRVELTAMPAPPLKLLRLHMFSSTRQPELTVIPWLPLSWHVLRPRRLPFAADAFMSLADLEFAAHPVTTQPMTVVMPLPVLLSVVQRAMTAPSEVWMPRALLLLETQFRMTEAKEPLMPAPVL